MVISVTKTPSIHQIFNKNPNNTYTADALLYQDILRYSVRDLNSLDTNSEYPFNIWNLTAWLIENNLEISDDYKRSSNSHMTKSNKIQARRGRVERFLYTLIKLDLLREYGRTKKSKGDGTTILYCLTLFGLIIALLIMTKNSKKRKKANDYLYKTFRKEFEAGNSSSHKFSRHFFEKLRENNLFEKYTAHLLDTSEKSESIHNLTEFMENSRVWNLEKSDSEKALRLKKEAFEGLDSEAKKKLMNMQKSGIEEKMANIATNIEAFENARFERRNDYEAVVTEVICEKCNLSFVLVLPLSEYLKRVEFPQFQTAKCPTCDVENSIKIPSFRV